MNLKRLMIGCTFGAIALAAWANPLRAQHGGFGASPGTHALAMVDDKDAVVVRNFYFGLPAAAPKKEPVSLLTDLQPGKKVQEPSIQENRFRFKIKDVLVCDLDGKSIDAAVWRKTLAKETAILFGDFLGGPPMDPAPAKDQPAIKPPALPSYYKDVYKADTLILYAVGDPQDEGDAPAKGDAPKGKPPQISFASLRNGQLTLQVKVDEEVAYPVKVKEKNKEGKVNDVMITVVETMRGTRTRVIPAKYTTAFDAKGKDVPAEQLATLLNKEKGVMESTSGGNVDPFYLRIVRPDALVLVVPQPQVLYGPSDELPPKK